MRLVRSSVLSMVLLGLAACDGNLFGPTTDPDAPTNLTYQLIPSGDPNTPLGVLLVWDAPRSGRAVSYDVFGRTGGGQFARRATTTSTTFHDAGIPEDQYYVVAFDQAGNELGSSDRISVDLRNRLPAPTGLRSISLNRGIQLTWNSNAHDASPSTFDQYRVYSTLYDATRGVCTATWELEGTTVSDGFFAGSLPNGVTRCFAVSAVTRTGLESVWSDARFDTPRFDARNVRLYATAARTDSAGFLFVDEITHLVGAVGAASRGDLDLKVERHTDGTLWLTPGRASVTSTLFAATPVADLTSVDRAPTTGFANASLQAVPGLAYVFRVDKSDGVHFGAVRVVFVTTDYVIFDWSYQSGVGNPELNRIP
jgi:hypothetical protein